MKPAYDALTIIASIVGVMISLPLILAIIKASMFFGEMKQTVADLRTALTGIIVTLGEYSTRITVIETTLKDSNGNGELIDRRTGKDRRGAHSD